MSERNILSFSCKKWLEVALSQLPFISFRVTHFQFHKKKKKKIANGLGSDIKLFRHTALWWNIAGRLRCVFITLLRCTGLSSAEYAAKIMFETVQLQATHHRHRAQVCVTEKESIIHVHVWISAWEFDCALRVVLLAQLGLCIPPWMGATGSLTEQSASGVHGKFVIVNTAGDAVLI